MGRREGRLEAERRESEAEMWLCIKGAEADGRVSRSTERAVASRRDGVEDQRGRLGGRVSNIGLHVQQRRDVNFHGEERQVPIPTAGSGGWEGSGAEEQRTVRKICGSLP